MNKETKDERFYLRKYLSECVLAVFSNRPEILKILEIASRYISFIEDLRLQVKELWADVHRLKTEYDDEKVHLVFIDGKLYPAKCEVEFDIYKDQYEINFPPSVAEDCSTKLIQVVRLKFSDRKVGYPKREEARDDSTTK